MRIDSFRIENFRNIRLAEGYNLPHFIVICGGNGSGKTSLFEALMTAKARLGNGDGFPIDSHAVSAGAETATITMTLQFSEHDRIVLANKMEISCPESEEVVVELDRISGARVLKASPTVSTALHYYSLENPIGYFEYIDAFRRTPKTHIKNLTSGHTSDEEMRVTLGGPSTTKFQKTKQYLAALKLRYIEEHEQDMQTGRKDAVNELESIFETFDRFFHPMRFRDVTLRRTPVQFEIETPTGVIDIDDLSGGEKEILNVIVRFHQLGPKDSVILFDEADAHLHPELDRKYLAVLKSLGAGNQMWITTHSPEMMTAAGSESLFTILKASPDDDPNQFRQVASTSSLYESLCDVMGSRGIVSLNQHVVFIEGEHASADRAIYEKLYPPGPYNVCFVPVGTAGTVRNIGSRAYDLLSSGITFQQYHCIIDNDVMRSIDDSSADLCRIHKLPVYHVENFLLDPEILFQALRDLLGLRCPYSSANEVEAALRQIVESESLVHSFARALRAAWLDEATSRLRRALESGKQTTSERSPTHEEFLREARDRLKNAIRDGSWRSICKGRELLNGLAGLHQIRYEHLRNCAISKLTEAPPALAEIMNRILRVPWRSGSQMQVTK